MDFKEGIIEMMKNLPGQIVEWKLLFIKSLIDAAIRTVINNWIAALIIFLVLFILTILDILINYNWRLLSKILYRISYLGILFIIVLALGLEILTSDWIKVILFIIGAISFEIVGFLLRKINFKYKA